MLGDGYFNYDIAAYTVAPPVYAMQPDTGAQYPMYPTCTDCAFIGFQQNLFDSFALCDPFFSPCIGDGRFHHRGQRPDEERAAAPSRTIALSMRASSATAVIPRDGRAGGGGGTGFARKTPTARNPPIEPRARAPLVLPREPSLPIRAVPLRPGQAVPARRRIVSAPAAPAPGRVVSLTLTPTRVREEPAEAPRSSGSLVLTGLTVSPPVQPAPRSRAAGAQRDVLAVQVSAPAMARERGLAVAGSGSRAGGAAAAPTTSPNPGSGPTPALFYGAQARVPATRTGGRRRRRARSPAGCSI